MKRTTTLLAACAGSFLLGAFITAPDDPKKPLTTDMAEVASRLFGMEFTPAERDSMLDNLNDFRTDYDALRKVDLPNDVAPALYFNPLPAGFKMATGPSSFRASVPGKVSLPTNRDELAFYSIGQLGELIRTRQISSVELTQLYLNRHKTYDDKLQCVITLTDD